MKTKVYTLLFTGVLAAGAAQAQMKIKDATGTALPDPSAILELNSTDKGLLMPKVALTSTTSWGLAGTTPVGGMVVFNTNAGITGNDTYPASGTGLYYYNGTGWSAVEISRKNASWSSTGNADTDPSTHFIGTTDNQDLIFKVNNIKSGQISESGNIGLGRNILSDLTSGGFNIAIGNSSTTSLTNGSQNIAIGDDAMSNNEEFNQNVGIGTAALKSVGYTALGVNDMFPSPIGNVGIGHSVMTDFGRGVGNTAIGANAGTFYWDGSNNTFIGYNAGATHSEGENNTVLGSNTEIADGIDYATAIGAGASVGSSNAVVLGRVGDNVGIGTTTPSARLDVRTTSGTALRVVDGTQAAGKVLTSDASGNASWQNTVLTRIEGALGSGYTDEHLLNNTTESTLVNGSTGTTITLPAGKWSVETVLLVKLHVASPGTALTILPADQSLWVRFHWGNTAAATSSSPDVTSGTFVAGSLMGPSKYAVVRGTSIINNTTGAPKTYYLVFHNFDRTGNNLTTFNPHFRELGATGVPENSIIATPIQ